MAECSKVPKPLLHEPFIAGSAQVQRVLDCLHGSCWIVYTCCTWLRSKIADPAQFR